MKTKEQLFEEYMEDISIAAAICDTTQRNAQEKFARTVSKPNEAYSKKLKEIEEMKI